MKTTATETTPRTIASAAYMNPDNGGGVRGIHYGINRKGQHVVMVVLPAGEDIAPDYYRYDSIEPAREQWRKMIASWKASGYIPEEQAWQIVKERAGLA